MAIKKATYIEPESYFNADMRKAADEWDKKNTAKSKPRKTTTKSGGKKK